jgi:hypothetical protein
LSFHEEVLGAPQLAALRGVGPLADREAFVLAGGTALALRLGHRISVDLDFFRERDFDPLALAATLRERGAGIEASDTAAGTLHATAGGVRVSFLRFAYPWLEEATPWPAMGCRLAALPDLAAMKLAALVQRGARKDFHDVAALLGTGLSLAELIELYRRKFGVRDSGHVLTAICYFDDAEREPEPTVLRGPSWEELKKDIRERVKAFAG